MDVTSTTIGFNVDVVLLLFADRFNTRISRHDIHAVRRGETFIALAERNHGADAAPSSSSESAAFAKFLVLRDPDSALPYVECFSTNACANQACSGGSAVLADDCFLLPSKVQPGAVPKDWPSPC